jgi:hypothetical protein
MRCDHNTCCSFERIAIYHVWSKFMPRNSYSPVMAPGSTPASERRNQELQNDFGYCCTRSAASSRRRHVFAEVRRLLQHRLVFAVDPTPMRTKAHRQGAFRGRARCKQSNGRAARRSHAEHILGELISSVPVRSSHGAHGRRRAWRRRSGAERPRPPQVPHRLRHRR